MSLGKFRPSLLQIIRLNLSSADVLNYYSAISRDKSTWTKIGIPSSKEKFSGDGKKAAKINRKNTAPSDEYCETKEYIKSPANFGCENMQSSTITSSLNIKDLFKIDDSSMVSKNEIKSSTIVELQTNVSSQINEEDLKPNSGEITGFENVKQENTIYHENLTLDDCNASKYDDVSDGKPEHTESHKNTRRESDEEKTQAVMTLLYGELMKSPRSLTFSEWRTFGESLVDSKSFLSKRWPTILLNFIAHRDISEPSLFDVGVSLAEYVESLSDNRSDIIRLVSLISICAHHGGPMKYVAALSFYAKLCALTDILDSTSTRLLIKSLSRMGRWHDCFKLLEMTKLSAHPSVGHYEPIIVAALRDGDTACADEQLYIMYNAGLVPTQDFFKSVVDLGLANFLLKILSEFGWIIDKSVADNVVESLNSSSDSWQVRDTVVDRSGKCCECRTPLSPLPKLSSEEFSQLRSTFMADSLMRKGNVFINSTPQELDAFLKFVKQFSPFDVIIDGLNVSYKTFQGATTQRRENILVQVIKHFCSENKSVMVLGRKHMRTWRRALHDSLRNDEHVHWFFTDNVSSDDPFMLYSALYSGQETLIVTNDELRDHRFLLGTQLAEHLKVWQRGHQVMFNGLHHDKYSRTDKPRFKWPDVHDTRVQTSSGGWHIPFDAQQQRTSFQLPDSWYCLQRIRR